MNHDRPRLDQINIVSGNLDASIAFYRRLGVEIAESGIWRTQSGIHHVNAGRAAAGVTIDFELDSVDFARIWNQGWRDRPDLRGKVLLGFKMPSRSAVDTAYADLTGTGHPGLHAPCDAFWGSRFAVLEDPDGIAVGLLSPRSPKHGSAPPEI